MQKTNVNIAPNYSLYTTSISELYTNKGIFGINKRRQRKYLFNDITGKKGHPWQRQLFLSLVLGNPLPQFELADIGDGKFLIEDGQQRTKTIIAIISDCIKLPKEIENFGDEYDGMTGKSFSELPKNIREKILKTELLLLVNESSTEEEKHNRFILINNGTPLTSQDKRSAQLSDGAEYLQTIVDGEGDNDSKYRMFTISTIDEKVMHTYIDVDPFGRSAEEIVAHWFNTTIYGEIQEYSQAPLNRLYKEFFNPNFKWQSKKVRFESYLKSLDKAIVKHNNRKNLKGRIFTYSFYVLKQLLDNNYKLDYDTFIDTYITAVASLRTENEAFFDVGKDVNSFFVDVFRQGSFDYQIEYVVNEIVERIIKQTKMIIVDSKRAFSNDEKRTKYSEQSGECGYCGKAITLEQGVCDHKIPHSHGGKTEIDNLVVSCKRCNSLKTNLPYDAWVEANEQMQKELIEEA